MPSDKHAVQQRYARVTAFRMTSLFGGGMHITDSELPPKPMLGGTSRARTRDMCGRAASQ